MNWSRTPLKWYFRTKPSSITIWFAFWMWCLPCEEPTKRTGRKAVVNWDGFVGYINSFWEIKSWLCYIFLSKNIWHVSILCPQWESTSKNYNEFGRERWTPIYPLMPHWNATVIMELSYLRPQIEWLFPHWGFPSTLYMPWFRYWHVWTHIFVKYPIFIFWKKGRIKWISTQETRLEIL